MTPTHSNTVNIAIVLACCLTLVVGCDDTSSSGDDTRDTSSMRDTQSRDDTSADTSTTGTDTEDDAAPCATTANRCIDESRRIVCTPDGQEVEDCADDTICTNGECLPIICEAGRIDSCTDGGLYVGCNEQGTAEGEFPCPTTGFTCVDGECIPRLCNEGEKKCLDSEQVLVCNEAGTAFVEGTRCTEQGAKRQCDEGECKPICDVITKTSSYIGCDYWAVDLDNYTSQDPRFRADEQPFAVVVSNATGDLPAEISVWDASGQDSGMPLVTEFTLAPGELESIILPPDCYDQDPVCESAHAVNNTTLVDAAFHIRSDVPITAYQFNPLENVGVFSNDASLLLPQPSLGKRYRIMTRRHEFESSPAFITVVATEQGVTNVTITPSGNTEAGRKPDGTLIDPISAGTPTTFELSQFDVLNIASKEGVDLTGSEVVADERVAVFAGIECVDVPETDPRTEACDHLEQQMYPINAWGFTYNAVKTAARRRYPGPETQPCDVPRDQLMPDGEQLPSGERDFWRVLARQDNTVVTTTPDQTDGPVTLNAGEFFEFPSQDDFEIDATRPILVGQFIPGIEDPLDPELGQHGDFGDPTYILGVPVEQYRTEYVFLTPDKYYLDYVTIIAPVGATVNLDGQPVPESEFSNFGTDTYMAAKLQIEDGVHTVTSEEPVGVFVYGIDCSVSYGYPAGLDLQSIFE